MEEAKAKARDAQAKFVHRTGTAAAAVSPAATPDALPMAVVAEHSQDQSSHPLSWGKLLGVSGRSSFYT